MSLHDWMPIAVFALVSLTIPVGMVALGVLFGNRARRPDVAGNKHIAFESGVSLGMAGRQRFPISFYLTAMLFIVFDIEMVFLYPLAVALRLFDNPMFVLGELFVFVAILLSGYAYVWGRGALEWE